MTDLFSIPPQPRQLPIPRPRRGLDDRQRLAWLRLIRSENVGPVTFRDMLNYAGGAEEALARLPEMARRTGRTLRIATLAEAERELAAATRAGARLVAIDEPDYPPLLAAIEAPPPLLYVRGTATVLQAPPFAIVGSRDASAAGRKLTQMIAGGLAREGFTIVSGLARGIDAMAHETALATGTIAVIAGGIDIAYPPENAGLYARIAEAGLLVAENAPGLEPRGRDFPRRNRIISGISYGVLVVEAARRSGSRITAQFALEQNREVFAVPGNPLDPRAEGTNQLLKDGATLVTSAGDILSALQPMLGAGPRAAHFADRDFEVHPEPTPLADPDASDRSRVLSALGPAPIGIDELARMLSIDIRHVRVVLLELELAGRIERHLGQRVALVA